MKAGLWTMTLGVAAAASAAGWKTLAPKASAPSGFIHSAEATRGVIEKTLEAAGSVVALNRVEIDPPAAGRLEKLLAKEGDHVRAGEIIAWMSSSDRAALLDAARVRGAKAYARWDSDYQATPILSPIEGDVILRNAVVGQTVTVSSQIYAVADALIVEAQVNESDIGPVRTGTQARIVVGAYPGIPLTGRVTSILYEGTASSNIVTYGVKIRPDSVPPFLRSQMTATVTLVLGLHSNAVTLPVESVDQSEESGARVFVAAADGSQAWRAVETGIESGERVEIVKGLAAGERVLYGHGTYVPQQAPQDSPLNFGPPKGGGKPPPPPPGGP